jgi:hypothetical protein
LASASALLPVTIASVWQLFTSEQSPHAANFFCCTTHAVTVAIRASHFSQSSPLYIFGKYYRLECAVAVAYHLHINLLVVATDDVLFGVSVSASECLDIFSFGCFLANIVLLL